MSSFNGENDIYLIFYPGILFGARTYKDIYRNTITKELISHTKWTFYIPFIAIQFGFYYDVGNESTD